MGVIERCYINDASLQGQFPSAHDFENELRCLLSLRHRVPALSPALRLPRELPFRPVSVGADVRQAVLTSPDPTFRRAVLFWFDKAGPFFDDERTADENDYFEFKTVDVTNSGLGEATRRSKLGEKIAAFSFKGGIVSFEESPLVVGHGLHEDPLGSYPVENYWEIDPFEAFAEAHIAPAITDWRQLVERARTKYERLWLPDSIFQNPLLSREPFDKVIQERAMFLFGVLNKYMLCRDENGAELPEAKQIISDYFVGDRAHFSGESQTNRATFADELTFEDPESPAHTIFAHWHGKISHRYFRIHFEWPVPPACKRLKVVYLGPKITKT